jgi:hypothetical protein
MPPRSSKSYHDAEDYDYGYDDYDDYDDYDEPRYGGVVSQLLETASIFFAISTISLPL